MLTRRNFLRGGLAAHGGPLRPPWALAEPDFLQHCSRCDACRQACPESIIVSDSGYPSIDFSHGECTFCGECVDACKTGALNQDAGDVPWFNRASIKPDCLALHGVVCQSCQDECEPLAITFKHRSTLVAEPVIDLLACTGCGACVKGCPAGAITIKQYEENIFSYKEPA